MCSPITHYLEHMFSLEGRTAVVTGGGGFAASPASSTSGFVSGGTLFGATNTTVASPSDAARGTKIPFGGFSGSTSTTFGSPAFESTTAASYDSPTVGNKRNKH